MEWTQIIINAISLLIPTGGLMAIFTILEKKTEMALDNMNKINEQWEGFATKEEDRRKRTQSRHSKGDSRLQRTLRREGERGAGNRTRQDWHRNLRGCYGGAGLRNLNAGTRNININP